MSGFFTGRTASIQVAGNIILKCRDWSLESTVELLSTNTIDTVANTFVPGVKGLTGSATVLYYRKQSDDDSRHRDATWIMDQTGILKRGAIETSHKAIFILNVGVDPKDDIKFTGYITSLGITASTGELSTVPITFTMDGDFENENDVVQPS